MKVWSIVAIVLALAGCASAPSQPPATVFNDALFSPPSQPIRAADVFAVSPEMKAFIASDIERIVRLKGTRQGLFEALHDKAGLSLDYDSTLTRNAAEAFAARKGNCLSIGHVNVTIRGTRVEPGYGHYDRDEMTIDFLPPADLGNLRSWVIDESTIVAMYMNNRAVEALIAGNANDAYWWARQALVEDPHFLSASNTLGAVYRAHGDLSEAQRALEYVLAREPSNTSSLSNLVTVLQQRGNLGEARDVAKRLARIEPAPPFAFFERGLDAMKAGDYRLARDMFAREVDRAAYYHEFRFWLALAYAHLGEMEQARANMAIALENGPTPTDRELYAAKLERLRAATPLIRR
jgi:Tfp pilus assembly protein PilF